jgi:hypothetical protein
MLAGLMTIGNTTVSADTDKKTNWHLAKKSLRQKKKK